MPPAVMHFGKTQPAKRRVRPDAEPMAGLVHLDMLGEGIAALFDVADMRNLADACDKHGTHFGIGTTAQSGLALHLLVTVSPTWIDEGGDRHSTKNLRNQALFTEAIAWGHSWCGPAYVAHARMDLDEEGAGVVDVIAVPAWVDGRSGKRVVAYSKALREARLSAKTRTEYEALQTSWARHAAAHWGGTLQRGRRKVQTKAAYLAVDEYKTARSAAAVKLVHIRDHMLLEIRHIEAIARRLEAVEARLTTEEAVTLQEARDVAIRARR